MAWLWRDSDVLKFPTRFICHFEIETTFLHIKMKVSGCRTYSKSDLFLQIYVSNFKIVCNNYWNMPWIVKLYILNFSLFYKIIVSWGVGLFGESDFSILVKITVKCQFFALADYCYLSYLCTQKSSEISGNKIFLEFSNRAICEDRSIFQRDKYIIY